MEQKWIVQGDEPNKIPTIHVLSDSIGVTAQAMARAVAACFGELNPSIELLPNIKDANQLEKDLLSHFQSHQEQHITTSFVLFYTLVDARLIAVVQRFADEHDQVVAVDLLTQAVNALTQATGLEPSAKPGLLHSVNEYYFKRIEAIEFTISHDDGRNPQDLTEADIVLLGVSRSSKTPLSIYLSQLGFKVANVPLDPQTEPPKEIFEVDPTRLFGLMIAPELLADIRKRRLGNASNIAASYADLECVYEDLEKAHALMRKLGCITVRTDNRAIEETAQEILRYYETTHPRSLSARSNVDNNRLRRTW